MLRRFLQYIDDFDFGNLFAEASDEEGPDEEDLPQYHDEDEFDLHGLFEELDSDDDDDVYNLQALFADPPADLFHHDPHPQLRYFSHISYDIYVMAAVDDDPQVVAHDFGVPLLLFIQDHDPLVRCNRYSFRDGNLVLPGEVETNKVFLIPSEVTKKVILSMLKGLKVNESVYSFFSPFDVNNILVSKSGNVTFSGVRLETPTIQLGQRTVPDFARLKHGTRQNIMAVHDIIKEDLFFGDPPKEIDDLLRLMEFDLHREIYCIHGSLAPIATYPDMFRLLYDYVRHVLPKKDLREILRNMPYVNEWKREVQDNYLLMLTFNFNRNGYNVPTIDDLDGLNGLKKALRTLGLELVAGQTYLFPEQILLLDALYFLDFLRNRTSHRMEAYWKWINARKRQFNIQGAERISFVRFGRVVGYLQVRLKMLGKLKALPTSEYL